MTNSDDQKLAYEYGNISQQRKSVVTTNVNWNLYINSQSLNPRTLPFSMMPTPTHFHTFNTFRPRQNGRHFADDIFKHIFMNENIWIPIKISLKFLPKGSINKIPALVQIMAWRRPGDKPLSGPMMVNLPTHICVTRPQWVKHMLLMNLNRNPLLFSFRASIRTYRDIGNIDDISTQWTLFSKI